MTYAGLVTAAQEGINYQQAEEMKLAAARTAASSAADAAKTASDAAMEQVTAQEANQAAAPASYEAAAAAAETAMGAYMAAKAASDAAGEAATSADAEVQRDIAQMRQTDAETALADAMMYAGMVQTAQTAIDAAEVEDMALADAKSAAKTAADLARKAATEARAAANRVAELEPDSQAAMAAAVAARMAEDQALLAETANRGAQASGTSADAAIHKVNAEIHLDYAQGHLMTAEGEMMMAEGRKTDADDLAAAQMKAGEFATAARMAADDAKADADEIERLLGAGATQTMAARQRQLATETAALAAEIARDAAAATTDPRMAEEEQGKAEVALATANTERGAVGDLLTLANVAADAIETVTIAAARGKAEEYSDEATSHYESAKMKAADARGEANDAQAAATRARGARTDYANAKKYADIADGNADAAETARDTAETAKNAAMTAYMAAMAATTSMDAEAERDKAKAQNDIATTQHTGDDDDETTVGAGENYKAAKAAAMKAKTSAGRHVIGLLVHANAQDLTLGNPEDVDLAEAIRKAMEARLEAVSDAIHAAAGMHGATDDGDRDQDSSTTGGTGSASTVTTAWPADTPDNEATDGVDESMAGMFSIAVAVDDATNLEFRTEAVEDDPDTTDVDESETMPKTATKLSRGLGDFNHAYQIEHDGNHAIVFTDKMQGTPAVTLVAGVTARELTNAPVSGNTVTDIGTRSGTGYTGVTYYEGTVNDDTDEATAFMGRLNCADDAACEFTTEPDGDIIVVGYTFTGSREAREAVEAAEAAENEDYLAFGVWLREDTNGSTVGTPKAFAAFANGGEPIASFNDYLTLTGTAKYTGKATGVHTAGSSVDYFEGDASLTANFGAPGTDDDDEADDDEIGTISGRIHNIMAGGVSTGDVISLREADIDNANTAFAGDARMGTGEIQDDDSVKYPYNGTWSGNFYGANPAVADDDATDADEEMDAAAPDAVAGTFGVSGTMGEGDDAVTSSYVGAFGARKD